MGMCGDSYLSTVFIEGDGQVVGPPNIVSTYFKFAPDLGPIGRIFVRIFIFWLGLAVLSFSFSCCFFCICSCRCRMWDSVWLRLRKPNVTTSLAHTNYETGNFANNPFGLRDFVRIKFGMYVLFLVKIRPDGLLAFPPYYSIFGGPASKHHLDLTSL